MVMPEEMVAHRVCLVTQEVISVLLYMYLFVSSTLVGLIFIHDVT
jgi:hypothetical protein